MLQAEQSGSGFRAKLQWEERCGSLGFPTAHRKSAADLLGSVTSGLGPACQGQQAHPEVDTFSFSSLLLFFIPLCFFFHDCSFYFLYE